MQKLSFTLEEGEVAHFNRLAETLEMKKVDVFRQMMNLYEDYTYMHTLDRRAQEVEEGRAELLDFETLKARLND